MNSWYQRHSVDLQDHLTNRVLKHDSKSCVKAYLGRGIGAISLFGLSIVISAIADPLIHGDRFSASAETCTKSSSLQNFLTKVTFGDDHITRYASAANAIENKRLEVFRAAKKNENWSTVANLAESQQTKVCDLANPPEFLQSLCKQLRSYSEETICHYGFSTKEFNQITLEQMQNAQLRSLIQDKQMQLRGKK